MTEKLFPIGFLKAVYTAIVPKILNSCCTNYEFLLFFSVMIYIFRVGINKSELYEYRSLNSVGLNQLIYLLNSLFFI